MAIKTSVGNEPLDLAITFISPHYEGSYDRVAELMAEKLGARHVFGCSGGGVIGNGLEIEQRAGVSITAAILPNVDIKPFHLQGNGPSRYGRRPRQMGDSDWSNRRPWTPNFVMLADPYSFPVPDLLMGMDYAFPQGRQDRRPGQRRQPTGRECPVPRRAGVAHRGPLASPSTATSLWDTVVAQGCRPIGQPMRISKSDRNMLVELDGKPPMEVLRSMFGELPERGPRTLGALPFLGSGDGRIDREPGPRGLPHPKRGGDGFQHRRALAIGEMLKEGQLVQFHLRDAETSTGDLLAVLSRYARRKPGERDSRSPVVLPVWAGASTSTAGPTTTPTCSGKSWAMCHWGASSATGRSAR